MRASDADRELIAERLRHATVEGRLVAEELEQRLEAAFSARTYGELDTLVADLPVAQPQRRQTTTRSYIAPAIGLAILIPIALALIAAVMFVIVSVFAAWGLWIVLGWWCFGHRSRIRGQRRSAHATTQWQDGRASARSGGWL
jgi:Domain of unknown function (DUF1707)